MSAPLSREPLSRELAQRVVDQVSPTLAHKVNVMDRTGIIIASSDPGRLGSLHAGAQDAVSTGRPAVIRPGEEPEGARAGVNLPLLLGGEIVGVVGLTGEPVAVMPVARVLVLTIQLLLTREQELDATARREARDRDLLSGLVNGRIDADHVLKTLQSDEPKLAPPWRLSAVIAPESAGAQGSRLPDGLQQLIRRLESTGRFRLATFQGAFWVLGRATDRDDTVLLDACGEERTLMIRGDGCVDLAHLDGSAKTIRALVARPWTLPTATGVLDTMELSAELAVACMPAEAVDQLGSRLKALSDVQRSTVAAYLDCGQSISETARLLFTHRNTVIQRLDRVAELSGLDPRQPRQSVTLRLGIIASRRK